MEGLRKLLLKNLEACEVSHYASGRVNKTRDGSYLEHLSACMSYHSAALEVYRTHAKLMSVTKEETEGGKDAD